MRSADSLIPACVEHEELFKRLEQGDISAFSSVEEVDDLLQCPRCLEATRQLLEYRSSLWTGNEVAAALKEERELKSSAGRTKSTQHESPSLGRRLLDSMMKPGRWNPAQLRWGQLGNGEDNSKPGPTAEDDKEHD